MSSTTTAPPPGYKKVPTTEISSGNVAITSLPLVEQPKYQFAFLYLFTHMSWEVMNPTMHLKAMGELMFLVLAICWSITYLMLPDVIQQNPLKDRLGYNNLCVGWDVPPAVYVAGFGWILCAYFGLRFCYLDYLRSKLATHGTSHTSETFKFIKNTLNICYAISLCGVILLLLIPPVVNVWAHLCIFLFLIVSRYLVVLSIYLEFPMEFEFKDKVFMVVYGICSIALPVLSLWQFWWYDYHTNGERAPIHPWIMGTLDYLWFVCLATTAKFVPENTLLIRHMGIAYAKDPNDPEGKMGVRKSI